ncbi:MAG: hypothetical protein J0G30_09640 [Actinomycetales bacterium]|nr:hypothetical protein [Actinomycetales bacterium]
MGTRWTSGVVALGATAIAIESLAILQAMMAAPPGCGTGPLECGDPAVPLALVGIGAIAALAAIVPAIGWMQAVARERHAENPEAIARDLVTVRAARSRDGALDDDDL